MRYARARRARSRDRFGRWHTARDRRHAMGGRGKPSHAERSDKQPTTLSADAMSSHITTTSSCRVPDKSACGQIPSTDDLHLTAMEASATLDAIEDDASTLEPAVGGVPRIFQIWWEAYALWFTVHVVAHDPEASTHTIRYEIDGELETIDLRSERWVRILVPSEYDAIATRVDRALDAAAQLGPRPARCLACVQREYDKAVRAREAARAIVEADEIERWENERAAREAYVRGDVRALETRRETSVSPSTHAVTPSSVGFVPGARVLVRFDDGADYAGTVFGVHGAEPAARLYTVHFDDGDKLDDVAAHEMRLGDCLLYTSPSPRDS